MDTEEIIVRLKDEWTEAYSVERSERLCPPKGVRRQSGEICRACKMPWGAHSSVGINNCPLQAGCFVPTGELVTDELTIEPLLLLMAAALG